MFGSEFEISRPANLNDRDEGHAGIRIPSPYLDAATTTTQIAVAGKTYLARVVPSRAMLITHAVFQVTTAGGADDQYAFVAYNPDGTLLRSDVRGSGVAPAINSLGQKSIVFATPLPLNAGQVYYVGLAFTTFGSTAPLFEMSLPNGTAPQFWGISPPDVIIDVTSQSFPPPSPITFSGAALGTSVKAPYMLLRTD